MSNMPAQPQLAETTTVVAARTSHGNHSTHASKTE
jgi:hypothetical protein